MRSARSQLVTELRLSTVYPDQSPIRTINQPTAKALAQ